ncbi:MAG: hypothetical protein JWQ52_2461 [Phenylobacterium sp.]|jgi:hypothetical protein|nr:hypothetical protein [Phenylobacterium sp.]
MADERESQGGQTGHPANEDKVQARGREANAAQPLNAAEDKGGPERYPPVSQTDSVERTGRTDAVTGERRSFDPSADAPTPRQGAGDGSIPASKGEAQLGPGGDPAEGKR